MKEAIGKLPRNSQELLRQAGRLADESGQDLYLVGGTVRDMLQGRSRMDIDLVLEGDGMRFARRLAKEIDGRLTPHQQFLTATVDLPEGNSLDVATARSEAYAHPGALPDVAPASIDVDLARRDFTINAMAVSLNARSFGNLVDPFGGRTDLDKRLVRILHDRSFIDDPTRLFRAVRFEQRLRFKIERGTMKRFREAVSEGMIGNLSGPRLLEQLRLICVEAEPWLVFSRLEGLNALRAIHPNLASDAGLKTLVQEISQSRGFLSSTYDGWWILYLVALFRPRHAETLHGIVERLKPNRRLRRAIEDMSRWARVEQAIESGEIETPADFCRRVRPISEDTMLFVTLTHPDDGIRRRCESFYYHQRHLRLSIDGGTLKELGIPAGPVYGQILDEVLTMKINGEIETVEEERRAVRDTWSRRNTP